tara:strand:- start:186646 stop:186903 length:258 start_codon:yes stop_codon:yes gene_type:complete
MPGSCGTRPFRCDPKTQVQPAADEEPQVTGSPLETYGKKISSHLDAEFYLSEHRGALVYEHIFLKMHRFTPNTCTYIYVIGIPIL